MFSVGTHLLPTTVLWVRAIIIPIFQMRSIEVLMLIRFKSTNTEIQLCFPVWRCWKLELYNWTRLTKSRKAGRHTYETQNHSHSYTDMCTQRGHMSHRFIYSTVITEYLLCAEKCWGSSSNHNSLRPCPHGAQSPMGETVNKEIYNWRLW